MVMMVFKIINVVVELEKEFLESAWIIVLQTEFIRVVIERNVVEIADDANIGFSFRFIKIKKKKDIEYRVIL